MGIKKVLLIISLALSAAFGSAQSAKTFQKMYLEAKSTFDKGEYKKSFDLFKIISEKHHKNNHFYAYSHYFCGLSAYRLNKPLDANFILAKIASEEPKWSKINEVYFLASANALLIPDYKKAYSYVDKINKKDTTLKRAIVRNIVWSVDSIEIVQELQAFNPEDEYLAQQLANRLSCFPNNEAFLAQLNYLVQDYNLDSSQYTLTTRKASVKKEEYNVATILPFFVKNKKKRSRVNILLEYYKGMQLASEQLAKEGIIVNLMAFDTNSDTNRIAYLLDSAHLSGVDAIVGPIGHESSLKFNDFAQENQIMYINPLVHKDDIAENNPYGVTYSPSNKNIAHRVSEYAFEKSRNDSILILYGESFDDSVQAHTYLRLAKEADFKIIDCKKITQENVGELEDLIQPDSIQKIGHLFVAGRKQILATSVISALSASNVETPVYCSSYWLYYPQIEYPQFLIRQIHFVYPNYIQNQTLPSQNFYHAYNKDMHQEISPTIYGAIGYDFMLWLGHALHNYGTIFVDGLAQQGYTKGINTLGYDFNELGQNTLVPILMFNDQFDFEWVNSPE